MSKSQLHQPRVYVAGGGAQYLRMFLALGYVGAKNVEEADLVCFTGGADIDPQLYGEKALKSTEWDTLRDNRDLTVYADAVTLGVPMVGICRGGQFLNIMNGGKMWQHVTDHTAIHPISDLVYNIEIEVTSTHHQMMIPGPGSLVLADANIAKEKYTFGKDEFRLDREGNENMAATRDTEVIWYDESTCLCFQPHPEIGHKPTMEYFARLLDDFIYPII